ncbi:hypothetical protein J7I94_09520 [Streptomyces sp. ISL-12]|uniref:hypothetical protein n=1 Tax=Streptomyces sp. ISL-12 TaxID=2819177 RepID=UPI001BE80CAE|nr:hypothetical protein [Streptomyces sp. ISL-12]MBT2410797.1 hypothetical protein [Streptomyces sp. ISL-12]
MRLCAPVSPCLVAAAALLAGPATAPALASAAPARGPAPLPACVAPDDHTFPLTTRVHGGPGDYEAGGGPGTWYLDLTNTTDRTCAGIHPVVVLVDEQRVMKPTQPRMEFHDGDGRPHAVRFEATDADELVGVLAADADGFPGFTVEAGRTLTVRIRLALTPDTAPGQVTANAAVVQRREGDGDWIGQSNDYRFRVTPGGARSDTGGTGTESPAPSGRLPFADELAGTGLGRTYAVLAAAALLAAAGATAVALARRRR